tara:strand:- start:141 stop:854 length:714 start_codon:yes stop_codon:yes gene_type:complete
MRCIIVDDEKSARFIIRQLCKKAGGLEVVEEFSNGIEAIKFLNKNKIDLAFLDIHMPSFNGFDLIELLERPPKVILTTSDSNLALDAFKYDCILDYLVKPIELERFKLSVDKLGKIDKEQGFISETKTEALEHEKSMFVNVGRRLVKINIDHIDVIRSSGDYVNINCENENYKVHSTLSKILKKLPTNLFIRVHRSAIINIDKIIDIEDNTLLIKKNVVPIGRTHKNELMKRLNLLK